MSAPGTIALASLASLASMNLGPFGSLPQLMQQSNPWHGFHSDGPALLSARVERVEFQSAGMTCKNWLAALTTLKPGVRLRESLDNRDWKEALREWEPWTESEISGVKNCEQNPCDVKLNSLEVGELKKSPRDGRWNQYLRLIYARLQSSLRTGVRSEYEFPGVPLDPWEYFEKQGFRPGFESSRQTSTWVRRFVFSDQKAKTLHQVLEQKTALSPHGNSAAFWLRDAYTDHYFDSWGEWGWVFCDSQGAVLVQALFFELDLLKKNDLFSKLMRRKMREESEKQSKLYLDELFSRIKKAAQSS